MTRPVTYYDLLGVEPDAPAEKIKAIYRLRSRAAHPDKDNGNEELQKQLNGAYEILQDPTRRREYNERLGLPTKPRALKPGLPVYEEILVDNQANLVSYHFYRWEPCARCWGAGCGRCQGKGQVLERVSLSVTVPPGVSQVVVAGKGARVEPGGSRGDLILYVVRR